MAAAVAAEEGDFLAFERAENIGVGGSAERGFELDLLEILDPVDFVKSRSAQNPDLRPRGSAVFFFGGAVLFFTAMGPPQNELLIYL